MTRVTPPTLSTERLTLRAPTGADWTAYRDMYAGPRAAHIGGPFSARRAFERFALEIAHWDLRGFGPFAVCPKGQADSVGLVGPWFPEGWPEREIGWMLWEGQEGKGYALEAARRCLAYAFETLGWTTAVSYIDPQNARSIAVAERLGGQRDAQAAPVDPGDLVYRYNPEGAP